MFNARDSKQVGAFSQREIDSQLKEIFHEEEKSFSQLLDDFGSALSRLDTALMDLRASRSTDWR
jgi:hypothetical protein